MNENLVDDGKILNDHLKTIRQIAWRLHSTTGHDVQDLYSEGCLCYLLNLHDFNPNKGMKLSSFMWARITSRLLDYIKRQPRCIFTEIQEHLLNSTENFLGTTHKKHRVTENFLCQMY